MAKNDNSVNIKMNSAKNDDRARYHHGDLRAALIDEGMRQLKESDAEHLSLRAVARSVGVSATAVYRHFPDKNALLATLCFEGDKMLADAQQKARAKAGGGVEGFNATGRAYVRFALANPALFRLMTGRFQTLYSKGLDEAGSEGLGMLLDNVTQFLFEGALDEEKRIRALQSWAIVHGLSMMMLDGILPADDALIDQVIHTPVSDAKLSS